MVHGMTQVVLPCMTTTRHTCCA